MKEALKLSLALGLTCALASGVLAFAQAKTKPAQDNADKAARQKALSLVLPVFDNDPLDDVVTVDNDGQSFCFYRARAQGELVGLAGEGTSSRGYGGEVTVLIGLSDKGLIRTVIVTAHKETPGLGSQATDRRETRSIWDLFRARPDAATAACGGCPIGGVSACSTPPRWSTLPRNRYLDQYGGGRMTANAPFTVQQDGGKIEAVSGATVTSRALADAVSRISQAFEANRDKIVPDSGAED